MRSWSVTAATGGPAARDPGRRRAFPHAGTPVSPDGLDRHFGDCPPGPSRVAFQCHLRERLVDLIDRAGLDALLFHLSARGYEVVGPVLRDDTIIHGEIRSNTRRRTGRGRSAS